MNDNNISISRTPEERAIGVGLSPTESEALERRKEWNRRRFVVKLFGSFLATGVGAVTFSEHSDKVARRQAAINRAMARESFEILNAIAGYVVAHKDDLIPTEINGNDRKGPSFAGHIASCLTSVSRTSLNILQQKANKWIEGGRANFLADFMDREIGNGLTPSQVGQILRDLCEIAPEATQEFLKKAEAAAQPTNDPVKSR